MTSSSHASIDEGCLVRLKNGPPCGPNALVLQCSKTHGPRVGKTVNIMEHSSLDPVTSILVRVMKNTLPSFEEAIANSNSLDDSRIYESLEVWKHSDVYFLDDSPAILGRVVAVDSNQAIVDISQTQNKDEQKVTKSSLKVFRLSELEICVSTDSKSGGGALEKDATDAKLTPAVKRCTRHVAGIVQHFPVCLLDPLQNHTPQMISPEDSLEGVPAHTSLTGFQPITMHMTNDGPLLLVKSLKDNQAFIIAPSSSSSGLIQTSSYVALSGRDQKPPHCTVPNEGCDCVETGLEIKEKHVFTHLEEPVKPKGRKRKRKLTQRESDIPLEVSKLDHATVIDLHNSEIVCLRDINGILMPIPAGLKIRPVEHQCPDWLGGWSPMGQGKQIRLNNPYRCVVSNQYTMVDSNKKTLLVTLGKEEVVHCFIYTCMYIVHILYTCMYMYIYNNYICDLKSKNRPYGARNFD